MHHNKYCYAINTQKNLAEHSKINQSKFGSKHQATHSLHRVLIMSPPLLKLNAIGKIHFVLNNTQLKVTHDPCLCERQMEGGV